MENSHLRPILWLDLGCFVICETLNCRTRTDGCIKNGTPKVYKVPCPYHPRLVYFRAFGLTFTVNVGKKDIHGWFGMGTHNLHF